MRIGVHQLAAPQQRARLLEAGGNLVVRLVDMQSGEQRHPGVERAVVADRVRDFQSVLAAQHEIVLAGIRRDMHEAGTCSVVTKSPSSTGTCEIVAASVQRMRADRAGKIGALQHMVDVMRRDADLLDRTAVAIERDDQFLAHPSARAFRSRRRHG